MPWGASGNVAGQDKAVYQKGSTRVTSKVQVGVLSPFQKGLEHGHAQAIKRGALGPKIVAAKRKTIYAASEACIVASAQTGPQEAAHVKAQDFFPTPRPHPFIRLVSTPTQAR